MESLGDFFTGAWGLIAYVGLALVSNYLVVVPILIIGGLALFVFGTLNRRRRRALAHALSLGEDDR